MARSPLLIGLSFLLSATFLPATGCLSFFEARVGKEQAATIRAPLLLWHKGFSPGLQTLHKPSMGWAEAFGIKSGSKRKREEETAKKKGKALYLFLEKLRT